MTCRFCDPSIDLGSRQGEGHVAVRFGDDRSADCSYRITFNGENVTSQCDEAIGGEHGCVIFAVEPLRLCPCGELAIDRIKKTGWVQVERIPGDVSVSIDGVDITPIVSGIRIAL